MYQVRRRSTKSNSGYTSAVSPNPVLFTGSKYCISILTKQMSGQGYLFRTMTYSSDISCS